MQHYIKCLRSTGSGWQSIPVQSLIVNHLIVQGNILANDAKIAAVTPVVIFVQEAAQ